MNIQSLGDLAQTFKLRQQNTQIKQQMARLTEELASGQAADLTRQLAGNFGHISDIEYDLLVLDRYADAATEAGITTSMMQHALDIVQSLAGDLGADAIITGSTTGSLPLDTIANQGRGVLESIIGAFNTQMSGRSLFSGADIAAVPLASVNTLLTEVRTVVAGALTVSDIVTALDTFFDTPGGGFETLIYQGGTTFRSPYQLGEGESVSLDIRADDSSVRNVLKYTVMAALADDTSHLLNPSERIELAHQSGENLLFSQDEVIGIRSNLGFAQSRVEQSATRISAEVSSLEFARSELLSVDKFRTATELENVQAQLETLYTLTARASRLSLVNYLS